VKSGLATIHGEIQKAASASVFGRIDRLGWIHQPEVIMIQLNNKAALTRFSERRILIAVFLTLQAVAVALPGACGQTAKQPASQDVD
jgi:hypothetical protein